MEENTPTPKPTFTNSHGPKTLKGKIIKIFIVGILIVIFLAILNYFNILPLSNIYQKYFSTIQEEQPYTSVAPTVFPYEVDTGKTKLNEYIGDSLKPQFIPSNIEIKQGQQIDGQIGGPNNGFGAYYIIENATVSAYFQFKQNTNIVDGFSIFIQPSNVQQTTASATLANSLTSSYFKNISDPISSCNAIGTTSYCENFKIEDDGKRGYGIVFLNNPGNLSLIVFNCFYSNESSLYELDSCITP